jgi:hypothetical protein
MAQRRAITDGFDLYAANIDIGGAGLRSTWLSAGPGAIFLTPGRYGGQALAYNPGSALISTWRPFTPSSQFACGFAYKVTNLQGASFCTIDSDSNVPQIDLTTDGSGFLYLRLGGVLLKKSSVPLIAVNAWNYFEIEGIISDAGSVHVYMNDALLDEFSFDNVDTAFGNNPNAGRIRFEGFAISMWDDVYVEIDGATRVGEGRIVALAVTTDDSGDFTPLTGASNAAMVDEVPINIDDYNASAVVGAKDLFNVADISFAPYKIYGVQVAMVAQKDESGLRVVNTRLVSNGVEVAGSNLVLALNSFNWKRDFYALNPDGNVAWTKAAVDALKIGYEVNT